MHQACNLPGSDLAQRLLQHFRAYTRDPAVWEDLWLQIFHHQRKHHPIYRRFVQVYRTDVRTYRDIPPVPITVFKYHWIGIGPPEQAAMIFRSSGTTRGIAGRSQHPFFRPELYRTAALRHFQTMVLPDRSTIRMLILGPTTRYIADSSLGQMLDWIRTAFGTPDSLHAWTPEGPDLARATEWILRYRSEETPILIFGTAIALYEWTVWIRERQISAGPLPPGSRIVETGGFKGRRIQIDRWTLYRDLHALFQVPLELIGSEYGMTELGSQFYDNTFRAHLTGTTVLRRRLIGPPWVYVQIWDPHRWQPAPSGDTPGPICVFDPVNLDSIAFIVTEDMGTLDDAGLILHGRLPGAEPRGCSLIA